MAKRKKGNLNTKELQLKVQRLAKKRSSLWIYKFVRAIIRVLGFKYFRLEINDAQNLNLKGRFIMAPIHRSNLDAPLLNACSTQRINSLAKLAMFKSRLSIRISAIIGCIPLNRSGSDRNGMQLALEILERDEPLMVFPEGLRGSGEKIEKIFGGCAYLSIKAQAPIVPVGIAGTEEIFPPGKKWPKRGFVNLEIGQIMHPPTENTKSTRQQFTDQLHAELQKLTDLAFQKSENRHKN